MFVVSTRSPGYKITPIHTMGNVRTNATYYEDVRVPADALVGPEHGGWWLITTQLNHERIALSAVGFVDRIYDDVCRWARETRLADGRRVIDQPWVQIHLARVQAKLEVLKLLNWQQAWSMARGTLNFAEASAVKVFGSEFYVEAYQLLLEVMGEPGYLRGGSPDAILKGRVERMYRTTLILTFGGGTNEVQRDIIAMAGLGMPRAR
jgi:alkylation response protein AidB-like acyl-CoA dehydrogenase